MKTAHIHALAAAVGLGAASAVVPACSSSTGSSAGPGKDGGGDVTSMGGASAGAPSTGGAGGTRPSTGGTGGASPTTGGAAGSAAVDAGDAGKGIPDAAPADAARDASSDGGDASDASPPGDGSPDCTVPAGSRVKIDFDPVNPEFVSNIQWIDSASVLTPNFSAHNTLKDCSSPTEMFGQAFGAPEGNQPYIVGGDTLATLTRCGLDVTLVAKPMTCNSVPELPVTTRYHLYTDARASEVRIERSFGFGGTTPVYSGIGIRPYVPRVPISAFNTVIFPNAAGTAVATGNVPSCGGDCLTAAGASWNGKWFADIDPTTGRSMIVLRDPSMTSPVDFTINNDSASGSNLSSFVLLQPGGGWKAPVTEIEFLCFADLTSWPKAQRDAAKLPAGCGP